MYHGDQSKNASSLFFCPSVVRATTIPGRYRRQLLPLPDGGTPALDWWDDDDGASGGARGRPSPPPPTAPLLLVLHGLTGGSREGYVKGACAAASAAGFRAAALTYRGCGGLPLSSPSPYGASWTADVAVAAAAAREAWPAAAGLVAAGYSLGAVILAKYLAEQGDGLWPASTGVDAGACVSSPFCLHAASAALGRSAAGLAYNVALAARLRHYMWRHRRQIERHDAVAPDTLGTLSTAWLIQHYDERVVARLFGFESAGAYYDDASTFAAVPRIAAPTLFLSSADDPFLGALPAAEVIASNPATALAVTARGGHCAFLGARAPLGRAWADDVVAQWAAAALEEVGIRRALVSKL